MSSSSSGTNYQFSIEVGDGAVSIEGGFLMSTGASSNDALALDILQALNGVSWPTGITKQISVTKVTDTAVFYQADLTTTPPSFT